MGLRVYGSILLLLGAFFIVAQGQAPTIVTPPMNQLNQAIGSNVTFSVIATGADAYQWMKDGVNITDTADTYSGTNTSTLTVLSVSVADEGMYSCRVFNGFEFNDSAIAQLDVDADCGPLTNPANGMVNTSTGTTEGMTATYSCDTGYNLVGDMTRTCQMSGNWSSVAPACQINNCGPLTNPMNGMVTLTNTTFGSSATYSCNTGYNLNGDMTRMCGADGWTGSEPTCQINDCGTLTNPMNGNVTFTTTTFESTATYSCNTGYTLSGDMTRMCGADGNWTGSEPTCQINDCGTLTNPMNGNVTFTTTTFESTATYSCNTGYTLSGDMTRMCGADGNWTGSEPTCQINDCGTLTNPMNGNVTFTTTTFESTATYSCNTGFTLSGDMTRMCGADGNWTGSDPTCLIDCGSLDHPANGMVNTSTGTTEGMNATYSCDTGYNLVGAMTRTCQVDGTWSSEAPTCQIIDCGPLTNPMNGTVTLTNTTFESNATYSCNTGYNLNGTETRMCGVDGWTGSEPTCQIVDCGPPPNVTNGMVSYTTTTFGSTVTYSCNMGYMLNGMSTTTCQSDGTYTAAPVCDPVDCGDPPDVTNAMVTFTSTTFMSTATYTCVTGYSINETDSATRNSTTVTCEADGMWEDSPSCDLTTPTIMQQPAPPYLPGDSVVFSLSVTAPALSYQWLVNGTSVNDTSGRYQGSNTTMFTVLNLTDTDHMTMVSCVVSDGEDQVTADPVSILILFPPVVMIRPTEIVTGIDQSVSLFCSANSSDGMVNVSIETTASNGQRVSPQPTSVQLTLSNPMPGDRGVYTCVATNARDTVRANATVYVVEVMAVPSNQTVPTGNSATFSCVTGGTPSSGSISFSWYETINGLALFERFRSTSEPFTARRVSGEDTSMLTISNVAVGDGMWDKTCNVTVDGEMVGRATSTLDVITPFLVEGLLNVTNPTNITLNSGDTLNLTCVGENPPNATSELFFVWLINARPFNDTGPRITNTPIPPNRLRSTLTIDQTTTDDRGEYTCTVANRMPYRQVDGASSTVDVQVFFTPELSFSGAPYRFKAGSDQTITCLIVSVPVYTSAELVEIMSDGSELVRANVPEPYRDRMIYRLSQGLNNLMLADHNRTFECRATNANGNTTINTTIEVFGVPDPIDHTTITSSSISLISMRFTFTAPIDNNAPINSYSYILCQYTCFNPPSPMVISNDTSLLTGSRPSFTIGGLSVPDVPYRLYILASNEAGMGPNSTEAFEFNSSSQADASPAGLMVDSTFTTQNSLVFTWTLPPLGSESDITASMFTVTWRRQGSNPSTIVVPFSGGRTSRQGVAITNLTVGMSHDVWVIANYSTPMLDSDPTMTTGTTLSAGQDPAPLRPVMPSAGTNNENGLTITWVAPTNTPFFNNQYRVTYTFTSTLSRQKRQTSGRNTTIVDETTLTLTPPTLQPLSQYLFDVDAEILPPGSPSPAYVPATPSITVISTAQAPNAPTGVAAVPSANGNPYQALDVSWVNPTMPNGVLQSCIIDFSVPSDKGNSVIVAHNREVPQNTTLNNLTPNTRYEFTIHCFSGRGDGSDPGVRGRTSVSEEATTALGVFRPTAVVNSISQDRFSMRVTFSSDYGNHGRYLVVIGSNEAALEGLAKRPLVNLEEIGVYVTYGGSTGGRDSTVTVTIGGGETIAVGQDSYANRGLDPGTYYVFVRLFGVNSNERFNDSTVTFATIPTPFNVVAVIVPIAIVAVLLLLALIGLLIFAVVRLQSPARRRQYIPGEKGMGDGKGKKRSNNIELRRTRLFSPMLNVGSPDVFTSANQPTTLICEASGTPAPEVTWTKDGEPLDKERFIQLADSSLFVNDTDLQDEGEYVVTAVNSAGQAEQLVKVTVLRPVPPEPDEEHAPVKVGDFTEKLALLRANDDEALEDEYADIELDWTFTSYAAKLNINKNKNRYINIIPYDHARVVLSLQDSTPGSDYINGSYVDGHGRENAYIATQGPIPSTFPDFWRMVWEMDSPTIVMVTNLKEEDKVKCHQYWPSYGSTTYGNIQVTLKEVENLAEYSIRTFTVTPLAGQSRAQMPVREVRQFHFLVWPDHGVPQYATALLTFRKRVIRYHPDKRGPMVVHCSAGVGRTGTFITIDVCLKQIEAEGNLDIFNFVRHMRFRRNYMVQTASQYVFIHDAVLEAIMCGDNSIPAPELSAKIQALYEVNPETGKSSFATQFDTLNNASPADDEFDCSVAQLPDNAVKNRFKEHLPSNEFRVVLSSEDDQSDYICASFVDGYRHRHNFIVTQAPLQDTVGDFWRMVWEHKSAAIIMLTQLEEGGQEMSVKYWPSTVGEAGVFGGFQVELSEDQKDKGEYTTRRFKLSPVDNPQESRMLTQFHYTHWPKATPPEDTHPILDLIDELQRVQRKSGNGPITVHCDNGFGRTGAFCTLYTVLERVKAEQVVDVFQAVKTLRIQRVGLLETLDEYIFIHKAVQKFLDSFSDYQNFK